MFSIGRFLDKIINLTTILGGLAIALMMLHVVGDVIARYVFNIPLPGTITFVSYYYMAIAAFIPLAYTEQKNAQISVEVVTEHLPVWIQNNLERFALMLSALVFGMLAVRAWGEANNKFELGASVNQGTTDILIWPTYYILPLGSALMVLLLLYKIVVSFMNIESALNTERAKADELTSENERDNNE